MTNIADHFLGFDRIVRELKSTDGSIEQMDIVVHLLISMSKTYNHGSALPRANPIFITNSWNESSLCDCEVYVLYIYVVRSILWENTQTLWIDKIR